MKRLLIILTGLSLAIGLTAGVSAIGASPAAKHAKNAKVTIRHELHGCHSWSVNGGPSRASRTVHIARGGTIGFVNNDVMPHKLVKTTGPSVHFIGKANMNHMSASVKVRFSKAGIYRLTTKAGEDYAGMHMKTIGEDNVLRLVVKVS